ncbi:alpha/beta-hydrolase [Exidia glandulosa HHB12029]|uniref:Alpha/beta-hydrolase n=1 Tax=Exidia glandulosa HHB12029 TaxID=1314781 RepID=A0A165N4F2_EXIGL|nr:alpha/beta-hydrolase [Exidia glandulosa HHB12029]
MLARRLRALEPCRRAFSTHHTVKVELSYDVVHVTEPRTVPLLLIHGLYGSKQNWRSLSKTLSRTLGAPVYALDMRNHGHSPHAQPTDYATMASDVLHFCDAHKLREISLLGHSMGGKTAMALALRPDLPQGLIRKLIVEDVAPQISQTVSREFVGYAAAMRALAEAKPQTRKEADELLRSAAPDPAVRAFLLTNLTSSHGAPLHWRIPHFLIEDSALEEIGKFPYDEQSGVVYEGETLFIKGAGSRYLTEERTKLARHFFPNARFEELDTGHWVHAEKPTEFVNMVTEFIQS